MDTLLRWSLRTVLGAVLSVGIVAATPAAAPAMPSLCYEEPNVGECPPLDDQSCFVECKEAGYPNGGQCHFGSGCCTCFL